MENPSNNAHPSPPAAGASRLPAWTRSWWRMLLVGVAICGPSAIAAKEGLVLRRIWHRADCAAVEEARNFANSVRDGQMHLLVGWSKVHWNAERATRVRDRVDGLLEAFAREHGVGEETKRVLAGYLDEHCFFAAFLIDHQRSGLHASGAIEPQIDSERKRGRQAMEALLGPQLGDALEAEVWRMIEKESVAEVGEPSVPAFPPTTR